MKYYPKIEMDAGGNHDFPRLARESGFYFNLYRGRVDWKQIDLLDVDRLIRERDLESLQSAFSSIASCNLTNEYDVKVLDPNFVKLFRLAQLSVDYLQYCRNYLDHCIIVLQEQLQVALHEVEHLQQEKQNKEDEIKQLTKKLKDKTKLNGLAGNAADYGAGVINSGISQTSFQCIPCGKVFVSAMFLQRHIMRRHPQQNEAEKLRLEVDQLQDRLQKAEQLLKQSSDQAETQKTNLQESESRNEVETVGKRTKPEKVDKAQNTDEEQVQLKPSQDDVTQTRTAVRGEQPEEGIRALTENLKRQSEEIESLRNQLKTQHIAQESVWQNRLDRLEQRHHSDIDALRSSLVQPNSLPKQPANASVYFEELNEKQVQISRPEMVGKGTQVEDIPERPQPLQEAFTKPTPNQFRSTLPKSVPWDFTRNDPNLEPERPESMQPAPRHTHIPQPKQPSTFGSQPYSKMSGDLSSAESSTEETSLSSNQGNLPKKEDSDSEESSTTTEDTMKKLSSLAHKPEVLAPLREDIQGVMSRSLKELGIDPEWKGIPNATYNSVIATLQHQRNISQKSRRDLVKLREDLYREVDNRTNKVLSTAKKEIAPVRKAPARPPPPRSLSRNKRGNDYTAEPRRERSVKPTGVYEEVQKSQENSTRHDEPEPEPEPERPIPLTRKRTLEISASKEAPVPVPPPRVTPTTAELLADMEKLRQQGTLLKSETSSLTKSNLKSPSSSGNIAKKRVVFLDQKDDFPTVDLNDSEFGMFQTRNPDNANLSFSNNSQNVPASTVRHDVTSNSGHFSTNGGGEPARREGESNVARIAREIEKQLLNKPKPSRSQLPRSFDVRDSHLDLILDDFSSS